ncbi:Transcription factor castor [Fasciola gigantica]|uniref:Transcription factor castor n=1 Tax=Fasciola gigantica TaxID=46835 RepID=A0A504YIX5_FASGI|nr:Transcription factor castor [Fasciola gigantica]
MMMTGPIPIQSVPPSSNSLYGNNQFTNGLFPSNPFPWALGGLGPGSPTGAPLPALPSLPISCCCIPPSAPSPSVGLDFPLGSVSHQPSGMTFSQLNDPSSLLNGLSNGNKLTDEVKPEMLVKELLAWSQAVSQLQQNQKIDETRQTASSNISTNHCNPKAHIPDIHEGTATSPGDEFNQPDGVETLGDLSFVNSTSNPIRKYGSFEECSSAKCQSSGMREHYHCQSCEKIIVRREEMIRHAKWHRKREESLQYGFMRYSPGDNCTVSGCAHNGRQTHYHCLQPNCTKVYISTSDVQMHANFHRKDAVIIQEGFQRFRASENCAVLTCPFHQERTTHFHCRRPNCRFTFKNKADMGCDYVVHSSSQILSHKRKHDRRFSHLSSSQSNDPGQLSDLSNVTFDSTTHAGGCLNHPQFHHSPYDLSPSADFGEPLDMKFYPPSTSKPNEEPLTPGTSGENSPANSATREMLSSPLQEVTTRTPGVGDRILRQVICLFEKCLHIRGDQNPTFIHGEDRSRTNDCGLGVLFSLRNRATTVEETDENWKIEGEEGEQKDEYSTDLDVLPILQLVGQYYVPSGNGDSTSERGGNNDVDDEDDDDDDDTGDDQSGPRNSESTTPLQSPLRRCTWPRCASAPLAPSVTDELEKQHSIRNCGDVTMFCKYWPLHIWQAAVLRCGLTSCSHSASGCNISPDKDLHMHCRFWPVCTYTAQACDSDPIRPFDHLVSHDFRLANPVTALNRALIQADLDGAKSVQSLSPNTFQITASLSDVKVTSNTTPGQQPRRRGRPPKYTKYIRVPRPQIPDELCTDDCGTGGLTRDEFFADNSIHDQAHLRILGGVKLYLTNEKCPDTLCDYSIQRVEHYHCVRPRCYMASDSLDLMNVHRREFHNHVQIAPGFEHFDRSVDCRRPTCHSKRMSQHYHCTYTNCDYAFVRPSTMLQHARKHEEVARARRLGLNYTAKLQSYARCTTTTTMATKSGDKLSVRQAAIDQLSRPAEPNEKPPFLPLGLSPLVAAQLPTIFPQTTTHTIGGQTDRAACTTLQSGSAVNGSGSGSINISTQSYTQNTLPGFLPIWAAAMAAAAAVAKQTNGWSTNTMDIQADSDERCALRDNMTAEVNDIAEGAETGQDLRRHHHQRRQQQQREEEQNQQVEDVHMDGV